MSFINQVLFASFQTNLNNVISQGLPIMVAGMLGIFVVIGLIILGVTLLSKIGNK
jgi:hypothetical protein